MPVLNGKSEWHQPALFRVQHIWRGGDKSVAPVMGQTELCFYLTRDDLTMYVNFFIVANMYLILIFHLISCQK